MPDEQSDYRDHLIDTLRDSPGYAPALFWFEIWNALYVNVVKRKRLKDTEAAQVLALLENLKLAELPRPDSSETLRYSIAYDLSAYDASYLVSAKSTGYALATRDAKLEKAATDMGIAIF